MKIRNTGTNPVTFNGGVAIPNRTVPVDDVIGHALIQSYDFIIEVVEEAKKESPKHSELESLRAEAKSLKIKGYALMKEGALKAKIEEAKKGQ